MSPVFKMESFSDELENDRLVNKILDEVSRSNSFFKSQRIDEPDLTLDEKRMIAGDILRSNKSLFLQRYGFYISIENLGYFDQYKHDYEVSFYLEKLKLEKDKRKKEVIVKNRRFEAMQKFIGDSKYLTEIEMKNRDPALYNQMIGQYMTEKEKLEQETLPEASSFSTFLMHRIDKDEEKQFQKFQEEMEDNAFEEEEDDDTESEEEMPTAVVHKPAEKEKQLYKAEFYNTMYERFLTGQERDIDYSSIDNNVEYDPLRIKELDEEEKYFDAD